MKKPENPPAFPLPNLKQSGEQSHEVSFEYEERGQEGMSMRDYFAAKAMQATISGGRLKEGVASEIIARAAYIMADKMLEERQKTNP